MLEVLEGLEELEVLEVLEVKTVEDGDTCGQCRAAAWLQHIHDRQPGVAWCWSAASCCSCRTCGPSCPGPSSLSG